MMRATLIHTNKIQLISEQSIIENTEIDNYTTIWHFTNIYKSKIGKYCSIGSNTEIGGAIIGNDVRIGCGCFIPPGVIIEDGCFIAPKVCFTNDKYPPSTRINGELKPLTTIVQEGAVIGANCTILPGIIIGKGAKIGAGSVVTKNIPDGEIWCGNPARKLEV